MQRWLSPKVGFALVGALYVLSFPYQPGLGSPNELCRMAQARALIDDSTLNINGVLQRRTFPRVGDLSCTATVRDATGEHLKPCVGPDVPPRESVVAVNYYPSKAPLMSFLGAAVYAVQKKFQGTVSELSQVLWSRLFLTIAPTLAMLVLLRKFLRASLSEAITDVMVVVYALGTMAFSYSESFMSHQVTAVLLFCTFWCAWKVERGDWGERGYLIAGVAAGGAIVCEYTSSLGVIAIAVFTLVSRWKKWPDLARAVGWVVLGSAPVLGLLAWYHTAVFGGPFVSGYKFLNDAQYMHWHQGGFLGIKVPDGWALWFSFFSPLRGLFALSPVLMATVWGLRPLRELSRPLFASTLVMLGLHAYFTSSFAYDSWGWTVGPRHLTGMVPFLMLPVGLAMERALTGSPFRVGLVGGLGASSVLATGLVGFVNYVPDDISTSVFGLALPLWFDGVWPVSWLAVVMANPASGAVLAALLLASVAWVVSVVVHERAAVVWAGVGLAFALHFGTLALFTKHDDHDRAAQALLRSVWVAPNGKRLELSAP